MAGKSVSKSDNKSVALDHARLKELSRSERVADRDLRNITSFADAMAYIQQHYDEAVNVAENLGNGFTVLDRDEKDRLVGVPFLILGYTLNDGDYGDEGFCSLMIVTGEDKRFVINDGGAGIREQLLDLAEQYPGRFGGFFVPRGLSVSTYATCPGCNRPRRESVEVCTNLLSNGSECGNTETKRGEGSTYYLDTSDAQ